MSNTIAQSLTALSAAKNSIAAAISAKGVAVPPSVGFSSFTALINQISTDSTYVAVVASSLVNGLNKLSSTAPVTIRGERGVDGITITVTTDAQPGMSYYVGTGTLTIKNSSGITVSVPYTFTAQQSTPYAKGVFTITPANTANLVDAGIYQISLTVTTYYDGK